MNKRIAELRLRMQRDKIDALLVSKGENIRYLSGFTGGSDARLLIDDQHLYIITDGRYVEQAQRECPDFELLESLNLGLDRLKDICIKYKRLGLESHHLTYAAYQELANLLKADLVPLVDYVEKQRLLKEEEELDCLRKAAAIGDRVFAFILGFIKEGIKERDIAAQIDFQLKKYGCEKESFTTIVLAGENAAYPHGLPGERPLCAGDMLIMDYGGFFNGYASDMTRTIAIKAADKRLRDYYAILLEAQMIGLEKISAGVAAVEVDKSVRNFLNQYELDKYFVHGTGHGVGLEIHEAPRLSRSSDMILQENMVVTVEPGIYIPGWGGIRIEDTVIVKARGYERITHSDKEFTLI